MGVLPPGIILASVGTETKPGICLICSRLSGASKNTSRRRPPRMLCAIDRFRQTLDCDGVGTRKDSEVLIGARVDGGPDLGHKLIRRHDMLARHVAAALGRNLILQHD